jgi:GAF domain-containing protein
LDRVDAVLRSTGSWRGDLWLRRQDGTYVPCDIAAQALALEGRTLVQLCCRDTGDRWRDQALRQVVGHAAERLAASFDVHDVLRTAVTAALPGLADAALLELDADDDTEALALAAFADPAAAWTGVTVDDAPSPATRAMIHGGQALSLPLHVGARRLGTLTLNRAGGRVWDTRDHPLLEELANHAAHAIDQARLWSNARRELDHRAALARILSSVDTDDAVDRVHQVLLEEALGTLEAEDAGIARWDAERGVLVQALSPAGKWTGAVLDRQKSLVGLAASERRPVIENEYQRRMGTHTPAGRAGARAVLAVPLIHQGILLGSMSVSQLQSSRQFRAVDAQRLELLAAAAALALSGVDRQRTIGGQLVAREAAHLLNNDLTLLMGSMDIVRHAPELPATLGPLVDTALDGMAGAVEHLRQLQRLNRVVTQDGPMGPRLNLDRSTE